MVATTAPRVDLNLAKPVVYKPELDVWRPNVTETKEEQAARLEKYEYRTREDIERFIVMSPQSFFEKLESNPQFRENLQQLMQNWGTDEAASLAWYVQSQGYRNALNENKPMLVDPLAFNFANWMTENSRALSADKYHELTSFKEFNSRKEVERLQMEEQEQKVKKEEFQRKVSLDRMHAEDSFRRMIMDYAQRLEELFERMAELGKASIFDRETQMAIANAKILPDELKTGDPAVDTAMAFLFFEKPETVLAKVKEHMTNDPEFKEYMTLQGLTASDIDSKRHRQQALRYSVSGSRPVCERRNKRQSGDVPQ